LKGLSRFIEAATAPQQQQQQARRGDRVLPDVDDDIDDVDIIDDDGDGWGDDDGGISDANDDEGVDEADEDANDDEDGEEESLAGDMTSGTVAERSCVAGGGGREAHRPEDERPTTGTTTSDVEGGGWDDDIDVSFDDTPRRTPMIFGGGGGALVGEVLDSGKRSDDHYSDGVPDSIKDFVTTLDMEFAEHAWKTPPPKKGRTSGRDDEIDSSGGEFSVGAENGSEPPSAEENGRSGAAAQIADADASCAEEAGGGASSESLADSVDDPDAELNDLTARDAADASAGTVGNVETMAKGDTSARDDEQDDALKPEEEFEGPSYNYDENKDNSPEPLPTRPNGTAGVSIERDSLPILQHQESWYLNAMEGGKGGVAYGERAPESNLSWQVPIPKGQIIPGIVQIIPEISLPISDFVPFPKVGMPLSGLPSSADSLPSSNPASEYGYNAHADGPFEQSELHCKYLELIMPLPNDEKKTEQQEHGIGTKKLPDGSMVLVNYEQLLQNEATKRILLQRSVRAYEHTVQTLQSKCQASMETALEQENELASANNEISQLKELVFRLQDEKEHMINERHLLESERAAAVNDKEYLEREVETIQEDLKLKEELCARNIDLQKNLEQSLQQSDVETSRLINRVEKLQSDALEIQKERDQLNGEVKKLTNALASESRASQTEESPNENLLEKKIEIDRLNDRISNLLANQAMSSAQLEEHDNLREEYDRLSSDLAELREDFSQTKSTLSMLQDENESLRTMHREYEGQIYELKATVESMDCESGEVDKLSAAVASLTYELGAKSTECEESIVALQTLQTKLDSAESRLVEFRSIEKSLRAENVVVTNQLVDSQYTCRSIESQNSDLNNRVGESSIAIHRLEAQVQRLNDREIESAALKEELSHVRKSLDDKSAQLAQSVSLVKLLQTNLNDTEAGLAAYHATEKDVQQSSRVENDALCKHVGDLRAMCSLLEGQKSDLEKSLVDKSSAVKNLEMQIESLNGEVSQSSCELSLLLKSLDDKIHKSETIASSCELLKTELLNTQSDRDQSREQISRLQSQIADLLKDHNATMINVEEQLTITLRQNSELHTQCEEYRMGLEDAKRDYASISLSTSNSIAKYSEQIAKLQGENLNLSNAVQAARSALKATQLDISEDDANIQHLQRSIDATKQELASMTLRHQELLEENDCLQQEKAEIVQSLESRASAAEQQMLLAKLECSKVQAHLDSSRKASVVARGKVANLTEQLQALAVSNAELEDKLFEASFETSEADRLVSENAFLRKERDQMKEEARVLKEQIQELSSRVDYCAVTDIPSSNGTFTSVEKETLLARIRTLEEELKAENLDELRDELSTLHEERQQLDLDNEELLVQLGLMQQGKIETQAECEIELETLREQVISLQGQCTGLHTDLDGSMRDGLSFRDEVQSHSVKMLKDENNSLRQTIHQVNGENKSLRDRIKDLLEEAQALEVAKHGDGDNEDKLALLELKLTNKEEELRTVKKDMKLSQDNSDQEIFKLVTECTSREKQLKETSSNLDAAKIEMASFNSQVESLHSKNQQRQGDAPGYDITHEEKCYEDDNDDISLLDILAEAVLDSDDYLRSQIIVLAQALQRSELQRADALERIFTERKANADALCQLGESAKRFYSTVK
jgi:chromosome segregation ATPase